MRHDVWPVDNFPCHSSKILHWGLTVLEGDQVLEVGLQYKDDTDDHQSFEIASSRSTAFHSSFSHAVLQHL